MSHNTSEECKFRSFAAFALEKLMLTKPGAVSGPVLSYKSFNPNWTRFEELTRVLVVITEVLATIERSGTMPLRHLYYRQPDVFGSQACCNRTLAKLVAVTKCGTREAIGMRAEGRGLVCGALHVDFGNGGMSHLGHSDLVIDYNFVTQKAYRIANPTNPPLVLVVEKATAFEALKSGLATMGGDILHKVILVTGKGQPDLATRHFLHILGESTNWTMKYRYIGDWDPHGLAIFLTYRDGPTSATGVPGANRYPIRKLTWGDLKYESLGVANVRTFFKLGDRDKVILKNIQSRLKLGIMQEGLPELEEGQFEGKYDGEVLKPMAARSRAVRLWNEQKRAQKSKNHPEIPRTVVNRKRTYADALGSPATDSNQIILHEARMMLREDRKCELEAASDGYFLDNVRKWLGQ